MSDRTAELWAQQLGLMPTPLFGRERPDVGHRHLALLDGMRASFLLSTEGDDDIQAAPDWAWSSNVRHHVALKQNRIVVSRSSGSKEAFERHSVESKLPEFMRYLELDSDSQKLIGAIDHLVRTFRKHRASLRAEAGSGVPDLESFLYLLAIMQEKDAFEAHRHSSKITKQYALGDFDPSTLSEAYVAKFLEEVRLNSASMRTLVTSLTIRHAGGTLFQEAHAEVLSEPAQMHLFGLADAGQQRLDLSLGVYYTPAGLARILTELAIDPHLGRDVLRIHDPACGSGIFLCEAIRVLQRKGFRGTVKLVGHDISRPAVQMARFSIACALLDWPDHKVEWTLETGNFFDVPAPQKPFDVVLMNPPFRSWQALSPEQKGAVQGILGGTFAGRPDLSTAFIQKSLNELSRGGILATLIPRGVLDSQKGAKWREAILRENDVRLIGTFGDHGLFRHAMVSIGAAVFERKPASSLGRDRTAVMVWADERPSSAEGALRALRRHVATSNSVEDRSTNWSIYSLDCHDLAARKSWVPTPNALGSLIKIIEERQFPTVSRLFRVRQGIKTGLNDAFIVSDEELQGLPTAERRFFRRVASGEDIVGGRIRSSTNIFYVPDLFSTKKQLLEHVPVFGERLLNHEHALKRRPKSDPQKWWEPIWPRKDLAERTPRILTKMFGGSNMAAIDARGEFLPLQAFAWMPQWSAFQVDPSLREAALWWYCRLLNSRVFFLLRRELASASTAGGQLDVSPRYIDQIPIPHPDNEELARIASANFFDVASSRENDELIALAYGTSVELWPK